MVTFVLWGNAMAQRRMFSLAVCDTDRFLELPASTQNLYFHLGLRADDDGFVASPKRITSLCGCNPDDLRLLAGKGFIVPFESGICVIKDWRVNNSIRADRYTPTIYTQEKALLLEQNAHDNQTTTVCQPNDNHVDVIMDTQYRLGKDSKSKISSCAASQRSTDTRFEQFWQAYPKKRDKARAEKAFSKAIGKADLETMLQALEAQKRSPEWQKDGGQYIPLAATWLNGCRWEDELPQEIPAYSYTPRPDILPEYKD